MVQSVQLCNYSWYKAPVQSYLAGSMQPFKKLLYQLYCSQAFFATGISTSLSSLYLLCHLMYDSHLSFGIKQWYQQPSDRAMDFNRQKINTRTCSLTPLQVQILVAILKRAS